jgi:hypothetical protein
MGVLQMFTRIRRIFTVVMPLVLIASCLLGSVTASAQGVVPDPVLKKIIQLKLGLPDTADVTADDVAKITSLAYSGYAATVSGKISSLSGLQYATSMTLLDITDCNVTSLAPIANLTALKMLVLLNNPLDLSVGSRDYAIVMALKARGCTVVYNVPKPSPYLTNLKTSKCTLSRTFAAGVLDYTVTLPDTSAGSSTVITPVKADAAAKMLINGHVVKSIKVSVSVGSSKTVTIKVTSSDKSATKTYTVTVTRPSSDCRLSSIKKSAGYLYPSFSSGTTSYVLALSASTSAVTITPSKANKFAYFLIDGASVGSLKISVGNGATKTVKITVVAQNGATKNYYVMVCRAP